MCHIHEKIRQFAVELRQEERAPGTVENYLRHAHAFAAWLRGRPITPELCNQWKSHLLETGYAPATVNSMVAAVNRFIAFLGWKEYKIKSLKLLRKLFRDERRELTQGEYERLLAAAHSLGRRRLELLIETICATGIRVSEVKYITMEAVQTGQTTISLKGKLRTILLPGKLCRKLKKYARTQKIASGEVFLNQKRKRPVPTADLG